MGQFNVGMSRMLMAERNKGKAMLLISLELDEVMSLSDRILVMYEGEIMGERDPERTTVQELGLYMAGAQSVVASLLSIVIDLLVGLQLTNLTAYHEYITDMISLLIVYLPAFAAQTGAPYDKGQR